MKSKNLLFLTVILGTMSLSTFAAVEVTMPKNMISSGTVSDSGGATTLSELNENLAIKAQAAGASSYHIIAAGGKNKLYGVAEIYK